MSIIEEKHINVITELFNIDERLIRIVYEIYKFDINTEINIKYDDGYKLIINTANMKDSHIVDVFCVIYDTDLKVEKLNNVPIS